MTEQAKQTIKRYDLVTNYRAGSSIEEMEPSDDGEWMRYEELESALTALREERDRYRTLANIGTWHAECRPNREMAARELAKSQAVIDKLADTISHLTEEREGLRRLLTDVASSGFEDIDPRIDYVEVQVDRDLWTELRSALLSPREGTQLLKDQELTNDLARRDTTGNTTDDPPQPPTGR